LRTLLYFLLTIIISIHTTAQDHSGLKDGDNSSRVYENSNYRLSAADHSVLSTGDWYKIAVTQTGIHKIDYDDLKAMGIAVDAINPDNIHLYGNGNGMLSEYNSDVRIDDLMENAIIVSGSHDGSFDPGDYLLFYGQEVVKWNFNIWSSTLLTYEPEPNLYTDKTFYFITINDKAGKRINSTPSASVTCRVHDR